MKFIEKDVGKPTIQVMPKVAPSDNTSISSLNSAAFHEGAAVSFSSVAAAMDPNIPEDNHMTTSSGSSGNSQLFAKGSNSHHNIPMQNINNSNAINGTGTPNSHPPNPQPHHQSSSSSSSAVANNNW